MPNEQDHPLDPGGSKDGLEDQLSLGAPPTIGKKVTLKPIKCLDCSLVCMCVCVCVCVCPLTS